MAVCVSVPMHTPGTTEQILHAHVSWIFSYKCSQAGALRMQKDLSSSQWGWWHLEGSAGLGQGARMVAFHEMSPKTTLTPDGSRNHLTGR